MGITKNSGLNSNQIKLIAIIAMTIDHITWLLFPGCQKIWWVMGLHVIGNITDEQQKQCRVRTLFM